MSRSIATTLSILCACTVLVLMASTKLASAEACGDTCTDITGAGWEPQPGTTWHCCAVVSGVTTSYFIVPPPLTEGTACDGRYSPEVPCPDNTYSYDSFGCKLTGVGNNKMCEVDLFTRGRKTSKGNCGQDTNGNPTCTDVIDPPAQNWFQVTKYHCADCES